MGNDPDTELDNRRKSEEFFAHPKNKRLQDFLSKML